eukprot:CAMPEP_0175875128 /NCGR_PEP_ID=MMETSP0107_2-20121207/39286_1 /TAXON_ID=195067 ORGANISM="Goniomonas pacifica, Strain CCMP1869" /NCGR_SAMPLE_ID=MMETSP0107_2 /ASSEMBLY_ACC=CAM_ASM_000203 /LENGTH=98 /DNA_ID=CAMNT_0017194119 /DNA_START=717 /DNA_END=1013 /DNA_ORIENTATION=-
MAEVPTREEFVRGEEQRNAGGVALEHGHERDLLRELQDRWVSCEVTVAVVAIGASEVEETPFVLLTVAGDKRRSSSVPLIEYTPHATYPQPHPPSRVV